MFECRLGVTLYGLSRRIRERKDCLKKCRDGKRVIRSITGEITKIFSKTFYFGTTFFSEAKKKAVWAIYASCPRRTKRKKSVDAFSLSLQGGAFGFGRFLLFTSYIRRASVAFERQASL